MAFVDSSTLVVADMPLRVGAEEFVILLLLFLCLSPPSVPLG